MKKTICLLAALCLTLCALPALAQSVDAQTRLAELGYLREGAEDMDAAVRDFQTANNLEVTGGLDEATLAALADENALSRQAYLQALAGRYPAEGLKSGDTGESVRDMQSALRELGYYAVSYTHLRTPSTTPSSRTACCTPARSTTTPPSSPSSWTARRNNVALGEAEAHYAPPPVLPI